MYYRLNTYVKLLCAVGFTWLFEAIAWLIADNDVDIPEWFNFLVNSANILQVNLNQSMYQLFSYLLQLFEQNST